MIPPMRRFAPYLLMITAAVAVSALLPAPKPAGADAAEVARAAGVRVLGAARGYASTALWVRATDAYRRGDLYETMAAYQLVRELQPRNPAVYSFLSRNEAYNISAQFPEYERREEWVVRGLNTLHEGQERMPREATLRFEEWHFILNRSAGYPGGVLRALRDHRGDVDPLWAALVDAALLQLDGLTADERARLEVFLEDVGLQLDLFDKADSFASLPDAEQDRLMQGGASDEFEEHDLYQLQELFALSPDSLAFLALAHWCRLHAMVLAILPGLDLHPHSIELEMALLDATRLADMHVPPVLPPAAREEIASVYRQAVANGFVSGIENALRIGGRERAIEFVENVSYNFRDQPDLLTQELLNRAHQEIQE